MSMTVCSECSEDRLSPAICTTISPMQTSMRLGVVALSLYVLAFGLIFIPRVGSAEPIGIAALVLSAVLGSVAGTKGKKWWWLVPGLVALTFAFGLWLGLTAR